MITVKTIKEARETVREWKGQGLSVGFVPTMGYLHEGHKSLIEKADAENDKVVVSIFVNPIQFGPNEDFEKYPRDMGRDLALCKGAGADLVFAPEVSEIFPSPNLVSVDVKELGDNLCGAARPGHFTGVCTIVSKLFHIVSPDRAYFGEKDAQQLAIIKRMVFDLNFDIEIVPCPIVREKDGLAKSSRNTYLSPEERKAALVLSQSLAEAKKALAAGERDAQTVRRLIIERLQSEPQAVINYVEIVDAETLKEVSKITAPILVALAVYIGKTRLIDNFMFKE